MVVEQARQVEEEPEWDQADCWRLDRQFDEPHGLGFHRMVCQKHRAHSSCRQVASIQGRNSMNTRVGSRDEGGYIAVDNGDDSSWSKAVAMGDTCDDVKVSNSRRYVVVRERRSKRLMSLLSMFETSWSWRSTDIVSIR